MTIESVVLFRRVLRTACLVLIAGLVSSGAALAQLPINAPAPVTVGSIIPFNHGATGIWSQIYSMKIAPNGNVLFLDSPLSTIYQLAPNDSQPTLVVGPTGGADGTNDCSDLEPSSSFWNSAIALDAQNNLYVTDRYSSAVQFCRVPYNASAGTWTFTSADIWPGPTDSSKTPLSPEDLQVGDDGTFYMSTSNTNSIYKFTVNSAGAVTSTTPMITGLESYGLSLAVDHAGNLFFVENIYGSSLSTRVSGIREIPATATLPITGTGDGTVESSQTLRVDPAGAGYNGISGLAFDAQGNLYFSSVNNSNYYGTVDGVFMIPNEGTPTAPNLVWADTVMVSPVSAAHPPLIDPRGYIWIATGGSSNWAPPGSIAPTCNTTGSVATIDATCTESTIVLWRPGAANLGSSPVGTAGATQTLYYIFSQATTPANFSYAQPSGSNFTTVTTNPIADPNATPPVAPCTAGTAYPGFSADETSNSQYSWCEFYVQLNTSTAGGVEGELQMLDSSNNVISGSNAYLSGIGQGPAVSVLASPTVQPVASGLNGPHQVAADPWGNTYVADSALKKIEWYPAGTTTPLSGKVFGTGLTAPTGVAVDEVGNLYIGDSGNVIEIPYVGGALATAQQTTLATGLGSHLNLATDASGDVFVADMDNKQVVEISNPQSALLQEGVPPQVLGASAGFTGPSAIATDDSGNVWVADGSNLWEISMPFGGATEITSTLQAPVTGLAVDPSGSVWAAEGNGLFWIPYQITSTSSGLNVNGAVQVTAGLGSSTSTPIGVALDGSDNAYVTYGSGATVAGMAQLGVSGSYNFDDYGEVNPNVPFEVDPELFNIGNMPLTLANYSTDTVSGTNASYYSVGAAGENSPACGTSTNTAPGDSCYVGMTIQAAVASSVGSPFVASAAVLSNAANTPAGVNIALSADVIQDNRNATGATITITPSTGVVYPGAVQVVVSVTSAAGTPTGSVILNVPGSGSTQAKQTQALDGSGNATFTLSNLLGGTYNVSATYTGDGTGGSTVGSCLPPTSACFAGSANKTTFTVAPAQPTVAVGPPGNQGCMTWTATNCTPNPNSVTAWAGNTYVAEVSKTYLTATVTSSVGTPTGSVSFLVNGQPVDPAQPQNQLDSQGVATFSTANLPTGVYNITAVYNGDQNFASENLSLPSFEVIVPSIQVTSSPATITTKAGTAVQATLTLMPLVGYSSEGVSLECVTASLPQWSECTFAYPSSSVGSLTVGSNTPSTIVVTISTNVPVNGGVSSITRQAPWSLAGLFGIGLIGLIAGRKRFSRALSVLCVVLMLSGAFIGMTACTNAGYSTSIKPPPVVTTSGTYPVQIITYNPLNQQQTSLTTPLFTLPTTVQ